MTGGAGRSIWWDAENRPISITLAGITTTFTYDGDGKRVKKAETNGSAITTTIYVGSYYEETTAGAVTETVKYYYAGAKRIAMRRAGTLYYMFSDHLGSTSVTLNATTGATSTVAFLPFEATRFCGVEPMMTSVGACGYTLNRMAKTGEEVVGEYGPKAPRAASSIADWTSSALRGTWLLEGLK